MVVPEFGAESRSPEDHLANSQGGGGGSLGTKDHQICDSSRTYCIYEKNDCTTT